MGGVEGRQPDLLAAVVVERGLDGFDVHAADAVVQDRAAEDLDGGEALLAAGGEVGRHAVQEVLDDRRHVVGHGVVVKEGLGKPKAW